LQLSAAISTPTQAAAILEDCNSTNCPRRHTLLYMGIATSHKHVLNPNHTSSLSTHAAMYSAS
jgi:hypothetical protein